MKRKILRGAVALIVLSVIGAYVFASAKAFDTLSLIRKHYDPIKPPVAYEDVTFPSRGRSYKVYAFYIPGDAGYPALIAVHGRFGSRHSDYDIERAVAWHDLGYNVLSIDLADNGGDTVEDNRLSMGFDEYHDVLGAFDYLLSRGYTPDRIGIVSLSMGASSSLMAAGEEPRIKAIWEDSGYTRVDTVLSEQAWRNGFTPLIIPGGFVWDMLMTGDRLWEVNPINYASNFAANKQAVYIIQSEIDQTVLYHHGVDFYNTFKAAGVDVTFWKLISSEHGWGFRDLKQEYIKRLDSFFRTHLTFKPEVF